ncbi:MAG: glycosyltransferase family 4 protein [Janthinobacterium lividum]
MRLTVVSDAWTPQVNGVVRTLTTTVALLTARGHQVQTITPDRFASIPSTYPQVRLALTTRRRVGAMIAGFAPDAVHIATEGPLGWLARSWCIKRGMPFTTSFHTRFPDYFAARTGLSPEWLWRLLVRFHASARNVLVATPRLADELHRHGISATRPWSRGVDLAQFHPGVTPPPGFAALARPIQLYVGRVSVEKNIGAFLATTVPGSKVVVGDGPILDALRAAHPGVVFLGALHGADLAAAYAGADVFVFPSRTDTFGLVMIEALASGVPVAGYRVAGPLDVIGDDGCGTVDGWSRRVGATSDDLAHAIAAALAADRADCRAYAANFSWDACVDQFIAGLASGDAVECSRVARAA